MALGEMALGEMALGECLQQVLNSHNLILFMLCLTKFRKKSITFTN
jgi:hypothetical protein